MAPLTTQQDGVQALSSDLTTTRASPRHGVSALYLLLSPQVPEHTSQKALVPAYTRAVVGE